MSTKVYAVIGWHDYYPSPDNTLGVFSSYDLAEAYLNIVKNSGQRDHYDIVKLEVQ